MPWQFCPDLQGLEKRKEPGLKSLRTVRELQEGMVSNDFFIPTGWFMFWFGIYTTLKMAQS